MKFASSLAIAALTSNLVSAQDFDYDADAITCLTTKAEVTSVKNIEGADPNTPLAEARETARG